MKAVLSHLAHALNIALWTQVALAANSAMAATPQVKVERVTFQADGQTVVGTLYRPAASGGERLPAMVVGGSLTSVKEQMGGTYARKLAERGVMALAIDFRHYGESAGAPRQLENPATKTADLKAAVSYLTALQGVNLQGVGLLGICTSGGNVLLAAAEDKRVKSVATVAGWFAEPSMTPMLYGGAEQVAKLQDQGRQAMEQLRQGKLVPSVAAYGLAGAQAAHVGDHLAYYFDTKRGAVPSWTNQMSAASWGPWLAFDPVGAAPRVTAATIIVHSDGSALPEQARKVYASLPGRKELRWMEGGHFDFYDQDATVSKAADHIARFVTEEAKSADRLVSR